MAKSIKRAPKKAVKGAVKKAPVKKAPVKKAKKAAKKAIVKAPKKAAKKAVKKAVKKVARKVVRKVAKKAPKKVAKKSTVAPAPTPVKNSGKRFLIVYHAPLEAMEQTMNVTPEQQEAGMALWKAWAERVSDNLADLGAPLINGKKLTAEGTSAPSTKEVTGYSLLQAEDWDELQRLLEGHPHLTGWHPEATIEVHEVMLLPGM